ncbi:MAG: 2Fe-2S iron-sulfur cluster-binding protein [Pseudomonadota bacterium]
MSGFRLGGGPLDGAEAVAFRWRGREMTGLRGDTLASALMAGGVRLVGRSFKYHRPRGIMSAGEEEAGALVTLGEGARRTPNLKAPVVELEPGLAAAPQNCWPSLEMDAGAVNGLLSPFFAAGFYYKTFMGPFGGTRAWMFFERFIRRAAGLGAASEAPDPDLYEQVHGHCDVLVAGSGPAGIAAALEAAEAGLDVVLAEQDFETGGDLLADRDRSALGAAREALAAAGVRVMTRAMVFGVYDHGVAGIAERLPAGGAVRERLHVMRCARIVSATGAIERPFVFGDNDRPGVMGAEAARVYVRRFGVAPGRRVAVATTNDSGYAAALAMAEAGLRVTLLDSRERAPEAAAAAAAEAGVEVMREAVPVRALGGMPGGAVRGLVVGRHAGGGRARPVSRLDVDALAVSGGWSPTVHLSSQARARPVWSEDQLSFLPAPGEVIACGSAAGVWTREGCEASGRAAGREAARGLKASRKKALEAPEAGGWEVAPDAVWEVSAKGRKLKGFVDPMHDVTAEDIRLAHREGFERPEHMKRYTTLGMATDQGKVGNVVGLAVMGAAQGAGIEALGTTTFRPPYAPVSLGVFAGEHAGADWAPVRRTPFHAMADAAGAVFVDAGRWKRSWYLPRGQEGLRAASMREAAMVRETVGVCDVSTLGKFRVQGPDAAEFLDRVYSNLMSSLPVGKARYGFMLREDGMVFDDGTVWRLGEADFLVTATTGHAEHVEAHLSRWRVRWPELKVAVADVTEAWAGLAVAGPRAREALGRVAGGDISDDALPFLGVREMEVAGVPAMVARISFSGERAFEVYARPADAEALWDGLVGAAEAEGGGPYGLEALDLLRVEKGHVTGREIDGRLTLADLGMPGMASRRKDFIGKALLGREGLADGNRPRLVGLRPAEAGAEVQAGALLYAPGEETGFGLGHVSSIADSPHLGARIALGFVRGGLERWDGRMVMAKDPTAGRDVKMTVVSPVFVDPEGERLHG